MRSWLDGDLLFRMVQYSVSCFIREPPNSVGIFFSHMDSPQRIAHYFLSLLFCFLPVVTGVEHMVLTSSVLGAELHSADRGIIQCDFP